MFCFVRLPVSGGCPPVGPFLLPAGWFLAPSRSLSLAPLCCWGPAVCFRLLPSAFPFHLVVVCLLFSLPFFRVRFPSAPPPCWSACCERASAPVLLVVSGAGPHLCFFFRFIVGLLRDALAPVPTPVFCLRSVLARSFVLGTCVGPRFYFAGRWCLCRCLSVFDCRSCADVVRGAFATFGFRLPSASTL